MTVDDIGLSDDCIDLIDSLTDEDKQNINKKVSELIEDMNEKMIQKAFEGDHYVFSPADQPYPKKSLIIENIS